MMCPCGRPVLRKWVKAPACALCRRARKYAREIDWRIERAYQQARRASRRKGADRSGTNERDQ